MNPTGTRDRLVAAATALYAHQGAGATSIRSVVSAADANLNAVHYYFQGKRGLTIAVVRSVMDPINAERLQLLSELGRRPTIRSVVHAAFWPLVRRALDPDDEETRAGILAVASLRHDPHPDALAALAENQARFAPAFESAWAAAAGADGDELRLGVRMANATAWGLVTAPALRASLAITEPNGVRHVFEQLSDFVEAGLRGLSMTGTGTEGES